MSEAQFAGTTPTINPVTVFVDVQGGRVVVSDSRLVLPPGAAALVRWQLISDSWVFAEQGIEFSGEMAGREFEITSREPRSILAKIKLAADDFQTYGINLKGPALEECLEIKTKNFAIASLASTPVGKCKVQVYVWVTSDNKIAVSDGHAKAGVNGRVCVEWILTDSRFVFAPDAITFKDPAKSGPRFTMQSMDPMRITYSDSNDDGDVEHFYNITLHHKWSDTFVLKCDPGIKNGSG